MFINTRPNFKKGQILKKEMLDNLRDYPREFLKIYFNDYAPGIISGSKITIKNEFINIGRGIIKFAGQIYLLQKEVSLKYTNNNEDRMIKVRFFDLKARKDFNTYQSEIRLDNDLKLKDNEFELGRFKLRKGARLRCNYQEFKDFKTEYNTINLINVKYSALNDYTLHPLITDKFSQILYKNSQTVSDKIFASQCLNSDRVNRRLIINYLLKRLDLKKRSYKNLELYNHLKQIIDNLSFLPTDSGPRERKQNKIIVD